MRFDNFIWRWEYVLEERREAAASSRYLWSQALCCLALAILRLCRGPYV